jgi:serine/threonine protein kinase/tetratricopeptide (TPR) repeat protein/TolB-like protein
VVAGRYRVLRFLAQGGMGEVYEAEDQELRERVALKTINAMVAGDAGAVDRFKREISLARKVTHPNVCRIFDLGQHRDAGRRRDDGFVVTFLTMELLAGETLSTRLRRGRLAVGDAFPLARQVASALDAAHRAHVVHRDLKSENVFLVREGDGVRAVVTDFGIARGGRDDQFAARVTGTGIVGTPAYMAPEQVEGGPVGAAADVYAFGIVLYETVTGRLPFESNNPITMAAKRLQEPPQPPRVHVPDLDGRWEQVILRCLARRPDERFGSAGEAVAALDPQAAPPAAGPLAAAWARAPTPAEDAPTVATPSSSSAASAVSPASSAASAVPRPDTVTAPVRRDSRRPLLWTLAAVAALSAALWTFNAFFRRDAGVVRAPRRTIAVMGLQNLSGQAEQDWLATALAEMLVTELAHGEALRAIPGDQVARARQELGLAGAAALTAESLRRLHALLGCDFVVTGAFVTASPQLRIDLRLADAALGTPLASFAREGSDAELFALVRGLGGDLRERLGVRSDGGGDDPFAGLPRQRQAARLYSLALESLRRFAPLEARDALQEAAAIEPENPLIRSALSSAWKALGHRQRAADEAQRAFELSSDLPREDRLVVEGRFHETRGDWEQAVQVYQRLWDLFPDNLEYGLSLTAAQTAARRPDAALASIARLRALPPPASDDVRIDLAEASAAATAADYPRQLAAAQRGAARAAELGAGLLAAEARIAEAQAHRFLGRSRESIEAARQAYRHYEDLGQPAGTALALTTMANAHYDLAELDDAGARCEEAIVTYRAIGDEGGLASALNNLALVRKKKGDLARARALYEESAAILEKTGNPLGLANAVNNRAAILILFDDLAAAREMFERARAIWQEEGDPSGQAFALNNLAVVLRLEGDLAASRAANEEALAIRRRIGQKVGEVFSLVNLGGALADLGELAAAEETLAAGLRLADEMGHRLARAYGLFELAELRLAQGRLDGAARLHDEALAIRRELDERHTVAESQAALARVKLARGESAAAELDARHAMAAFSGDQRRAEEGRASALLALALLDQRLLAEARRAAEDAAALGGGSEQLAVRFRVRFAQARVAAAAGDKKQALAMLARLADEAASAGFAALRHEAELARSEIEARGRR